MMPEWILAVIWTLAGLLGSSALGYYIAKKKNNRTAAISALLAVVFVILGVILQTRDDSRLKQGIENTTDTTSSAKNTVPLVERIIPPAVDPISTRRAEDEAKFNRSPQKALNTINSSPDYVARDTTPPSISATTGSVSEPKKELIETAEPKSIHRSMSSPAIRSFWGYRHPRTGQIIEINVEGITPKYKPFILSALKTAIAASEHRSDANNPEG